MNGLVSFVDLYVKIKQNYMNINPDKLKKRVATGLTKNVLDELASAFKGRHPEHHNTCILLLGRFDHLTRTERNNTESNDYLIKERNKINLATIELIHTLEELKNQRSSKWSGKSTETWGDTVESEYFLPRLGMALGVVLTGAQDIASWLGGNTEFVISLWTKLAFLALGFFSYYAYLKTTWLKEYEDSPIIENDFNHFLVYEVFSFRAPRLIIPYAVLLTFLLIALCTHWGGWGILGAARLNYGKI